MQKSTLLRPAVLFVLFFFSGLSGLIYEATWSHYLKLFLGHSAHAQTLVLIIFMGGMALGAWLASRWVAKWKNLLLVYAIIEAVIGVAAIVFHRVFVGATDVAYAAIIPALESAWAVGLFKWSLAATLILPQSVLLGATFPLMSGGMIRRFPQQPGASLAMLYFTNSLGAAIGVLVSGFWLMERVGLPGGLLTGGIINVLIALFVWLLARDRPETAPREAKSRREASGVGFWRLMLLTSFVTGLASFIYEIGWIRMLSLVLGSSTHAFEIMLSAFILGLAFGGLWLRRRIDGLSDPLRFLGIVQIIMGVCALTTVVAYNSSFDAMRLIMESLARTPSGYSLFNVASHAIALAVMLPATFCAGMTLPLITYLLLRDKHGEQSIGMVYAANTVGAIVGVILAVHIGLVWLGLKGVIAAGAAMDMTLGIVLLWKATKQQTRWVPATGLVVTVVALAAVLIGIRFDVHKMASGVYRTGAIGTPQNEEIVFHRDGKTATVSLLKDRDGLTILTNGKPDASINLRPGAMVDHDEPTMMLAGIIPLVLKPDARTIANIGIGSGLTSATLLSSPDVARVDTIEIEPLMIEAAKGFRARTEPVYSDPRSRFHIDDAKTFFSANRSRYDVIVSEPSNPWVSGVAGLFSEEFYRRARGHLTSGGMFVQWVQLYEMEVELVASIIKALSSNFADYRLYGSNEGDLIIVAVREGKVPVATEAAFARPHIVETLKRIGVATLSDFRLREIGDRTLLEPMFASYSIPSNSDYFPVLDLGAVRARFLRSHASGLILLTRHPLPVLEMLAKQSIGDDRPPTPGVHFSRSVAAYRARLAPKVYQEGKVGIDEMLDQESVRHLLFARHLASACGGTANTVLWLESVFQIMNGTVPYHRQTAEKLWGVLRTSDCHKRLDPLQREMFALLGAVARRDAAQMAQLAESLLSRGAVASHYREYVLTAGVLGRVAVGQPAEARAIWVKYRAGIAGLPLALRLLLAHAGKQTAHSDAGTARAPGSDVQPKLPSPG